MHLRNKQLELNQFQSKVGNLEGLGAQPELGLTALENKAFCCCPHELNQCINRGGRKAVRPPEFSMVPEVGTSHR